MHFKFVSRCRQQQSK